MNLVKHVNFSLKVSFKNEEWGINSRGVNLLEYCFVVKDGFFAKLATLI